MSELQPKNSRERGQGDWTLEAVGHCNVGLLTLVLRSAHRIFEGTGPGACSLCMMGQEREQHSPILLRRESLIL